MFLKLQHHATFFADNENNICIKDINIKLLLVPSFYIKFKVETYRMLNLQVVSSLDTKSIVPFPQKTSRSCFHLAMR